MQLQRLLAKCNNLIIGNCKPLCKRLAASCSLLRHLIIEIVDVQMDINNVKRKGKQIKTKLHKQAMQGNET